MSMNKLSSVKLSIENTFPNLEELNLSFNNLFPMSIETLSLIPNLK